MKTKKEKTEQEQIHSIKNPKVTYNPELDKYDDIVMFPEKVKKAKEAIARGGLPKAYYEQIARQKAEKKE
jgi:hypothetical protein